MRFWRRTSENNVCPAVLPQGHGLLLQILPLFLINPKVSQWQSLRCQKRYEMIAFLRGNRQHPSGFGDKK
jgi:hypothetical protein